MDPSLDTIDNGLIGKLMQEDPNFMRKLQIIKDKILVNLGEYANTLTTIESNDATPRTKKSPATNMVGELLTKLNVKSSKLAIADGNSSNDQNSLFSKKATSVEMASFSPKAIKQLEGVMDGLDMVGGSDKPTKKKKGIFGIIFGALRSILAINFFAKILGIKLPSWVIGVGKGAGILSGVVTLAVGLIWVAIDGIRGFFMSEQWGTSKVGAVIGGALGGLNGGLKGAFVGMGKWAMVGAGLGSIIPGAGTIAGGLIGAALGGIIGWIGGARVAKAMDATGKWFKDMWGKISKWFGEIFTDGFMTGLGNLWTAFLEFNVKLFDGMMKGLKWLGDKITTGSKWVWDGLKKVLSSVGSIFKKIGVFLWDGIKEFSVKLFDGMMKGLKWLGDKVTTVSKWVWDGLKKVLSSVGPIFKKIGVFLWDGIKEFSITIFNLLKKGFMVLFNMPKKIFGVIAKGIQWVLAKATNMDAIMGDIFRGTGIIFTRIGKVVKTIVKSVGDFANSLKNTVVSIFGGVWKVIKYIYKRVKDFWSGVIDIFANTSNDSGSWIDRLKIKISETWATMKAIFPNMIAGAKQWVADMKVKVKQQWDDISNLFPAIKDSIAKWAGGVKADIDAFWVKLNNAFPNLSGAIEKWVTAFQLKVEEFWAKMQMAFPNVTKVLTDWVEKIQTKATEFWDKIKQALPNIGPIITQWGEDIKKDVSEFWAKVKKAIPNVTGGATAWANGIKDNISEFWDGIVDTFDTILDPISNWAVDIKNNIAKHLGIIKEKFIKLLKKLSGGKSEEEEDSAVDIARELTEKILLNTSKVFDDIAETNAQIASDIKAVNKTLGALLRLTDTIGTDHTLKISNTNTLLSELLIKDTTILTSPSAPAKVDTGSSDAVSTNNPIKNGRENYNRRI